MSSKKSSFFSGTNFSTENIRFFFSLGVLDRPETKITTYTLPSIDFGSD